MALATISCDSACAGYNSNPGDTLEENDFSLSEIAFVMEWDDDSAGDSGVCPLGIMIDKKVETGVNKNFSAQDLCAMFNDLNMDTEFQDPFKDLSDRDWRNVDRQLKLSFDLQCLGSTPPPTSAVW